MNKTAYSAVTQTPKAEPPSPSNYQPCRQCHGSTPKAMLAQYGALCRQCFDAYCRDGGSSVPLSRDQRLALLERLQALGSAGRGEGWAHRLGQRHAAGERLTRGQVQAYERVLAVVELRNANASRQGFELPEPIPLPGPALDLPPIDAYTAGGEA